MSFLRSIALCLALAAASVAAASVAAASEPAWDALRAGGAVAMVRHARAPGVGDPPGFRLDDCGTQRNLSEDGREQARALGRRIAIERVTVSDLRSSRWCRALETARLAFPEVAVLPDRALDSFFDAREDGPRQTVALRDLVLGWSGRPGARVLVTHQVNITALTGIGLAEGEIVVVRPSGDRLVVIGRIPP